MTLLVSPLEASVGGGPLLTLAGSAVDLSAVQDPLTDAVSALWTDESTGGVVSVRPPAYGSGYALDASAGAATLVSTEEAAVLDVELESLEPTGGQTGALVLGLVAGTRTLSLSSTVLLVDGTPHTIFGSPPTAIAGRVLLRLLKAPGRRLLAFVNGARVADFEWTDVGARIVIENSLGQAIVTRYLRRPVVVVGGGLATEVDVRGAARCLVNSPPRAVDGPDVGAVTAYRAAGASESTGDILTYVAPEQLTMGSFSLPGGA